MGDSVHATREGGFNNPDKDRRVSEERWIIIPDTHEPLVSREMFAEVQEKIKRQVQNIHARNAALEHERTPENFFLGKCICACCRKNIGVVRSNSGSNYFYYRCTTTPFNRHMKCVAHGKIKYQELHNVVFQVIKYHMKLCLEKTEVLSKDFLPDKDWVAAVKKFMGKRKLTKEMADAFVERIVLDKEGNVEITLKYDDFLKELLQTAEGDARMTKKVIAVYLRLSGEDKDTGRNESNSIANQRQLMLDYIWSDKALSECEVREFVDDGVSGARFDRAAFQEMIEQTQNGKIQIIITKDYSRLGRDYLEVGKYMECLFPLLHVRYIAVSERYDSDNYAGKTGGMEVGIKNIVNMMYSRDASQKVMAARKVLTEQGKFIGSFAPYGYVKFSEDKHKLIPDPEAAEVVKRIFTLAAEGKKYKEIARILNEAGVETCLDYQKSHGRERKHGTEIKVHQWSVTTVMDILYSEVYIGTIINNRIAHNQRTGYKSKRRKPEEWTVVENCHEPIISRELYEAAHKKLDRKSQAKKVRSGNSSARLFLCGCCGHALIKRHGKYKCPANHKERYIRKRKCKTVEDFKEYQIWNLESANELDKLKTEKKQAKSDIRMINACMSENLYTAFGYVDEMEELDYGAEDIVPDIYDYQKRDIADEFGIVESTDRVAIDMVDTGKEWQERLPKMEESELM